MGYGVSLARPLRGVMTGGHDRASIAALVPGTAPDGPGRPRTAFTFSFPLALLCLAIAAAADVVSAVLRSFLVQSRTPDALRGRVSSIHILVVTGGPRIGDAEAAAVAAVAGPVVSVVSGGVLTVVGVGLVALLMPEFARVDMRKAAAETAAMEAEMEAARA